MSNVIQTIEELDAVLHWRNKHAIAIKERDALQLLLNDRDEQLHTLEQSRRAEFENGQAAERRLEELQEERQKLIAYGRNSGLAEASTLCSQMAYETYYPAGSRFKHFVPKAQEQMGNLLIKAANAIASLPDGPYDRFKARQQKAAEKSATA